MRMSTTNTILAIQPAIDEGLLRQLEATLHAHIPVTQAMGIRVQSWNAEGLQISAPLAPNINHLATAFGGSLAAVTTIASWGMVWLMLQHPPSSMHIVIQESNLTYIRPVTQDFVACCRWPDAATWDRLQYSISRYGKGRIEMRSEIYEHNQPCVGFHGRFVVLSEAIQVAA